MLKKHLKPSERGKANKLQADLKRLLKKDAAEGAESAPTADMDLPRCSRCENLLLEELQVCKQIIFLFRIRRLPEIYIYNIFISHQCPGQSDCLKFAVILSWERS